MRICLVLIFFNFIVFHGFAQKVEVHEIKLLPKLKYEEPISAIPEDSCFKRTYSLGDSFLNLEHINYRNRYCMIGWERKNLLDTLIIGGHVMNVQQEIIKMVSASDAKPYYEKNPANLLVSRLFKIMTSSNTYYVICFFDTNTLSMSIPDDFIIIYDKMNNKILLFGVQAEIINYDALFGDFDSDGVTEFIYWDYGEAKLISLDGQQNSYENIKIEIQEVERFSKYFMEVTNKDTGSKLSRELNISNTLPETDYRN